MRKRYFALAWLESLALLLASPAYGQNQAHLDQPTGPPSHGSNEDDEYYLEDTGEKEYYYYDQDEYYEYFQGKDCPVRLSTF